MSRKLKIIIIILIAVVTSLLVANTVFIAGTPYINRSLIAELRFNPTIIATNTTDYLASITKGKDGIRAYQQRRIDSYVAQRIDSQGSNNVLPPPINPADFVARGFVPIARDTYEKINVSAKVVEMYYGSKSKFKQISAQFNGKDVEAWVAL